MSIFLYRLTFFGLTQQYRLSLFKQIHEIVFHGKGGYDWNAVYNMPVWLRNFTFQEIKKFYDDENEQYKKAQKKSNNPNQQVFDPTNTDKSKVPDFVKKTPTYSTKASKK